LDAYTFDEQSRQAAGRASDHDPRCREAILLAHVPTWEILVPTSEIGVPSDGRFSAITLAFTNAGRFISCKIVRNIKKEVAGRALEGTGSGERKYVFSLFCG
jgi:hypothetical protein